MDKFNEADDKPFIGHYSVIIPYSTIFHKKYLTNYPKLMRVSKYNAEKYNVKYVIDFNDHYNFLINNKNYFNVENETCFISGDNLHQIKNLADEAVEMYEQMEREGMSRLGLFC